MRATLLSVNENAVKGKYRGCEFTYQPDPYKGQAKDPATRFVFSNNPLVSELQNIPIGSYVEITFDNTQYKNPETIKLIAKQEEAPRISPNTAPNKGGYNNNDPETQARISRSVALKEACSLVTAVVAAGGYPATAIKKPDMLASEIMRLAVEFANYLDGVDKNKVEKAVLPDEDSSPFGDDEYGS